MTDRPGAAGRHWPVPGGEAPRRAQLHRPGPRGRRVDARLGLETRYICRPQDLPTDRYIADALTRIPPRVTRAGDTFMAAGHRGPGREEALHSASAPAATCVSGEISS